MIIMRGNSSSNNGKRMMDVNGWDANGCDLDASSGADNSECSRRDVGEGVEQPLGVTVTVKVFSQDSSQDDEDDDDDED
jgi:hypothetical protein